MDATINPVSGTSQPHTLPVIKAPPAPPPAPPVYAEAPAQTQTNNPPAPSSASEYEASVRQAALSFKDVYAVSDQEFTIFKDATGKYITRYVSLRDGKVTYIPEPAYVKPLQPDTGGAPAHIAISV